MVLYIAAVDPSLGALLAQEKAVDKKNALYYLRTIDDPEKRIVT